MQMIQVYNNLNVEPQHVDLKVPLYSFGCEKKVRNTLSRIKGIYSINVDYSQQKVTVWGICNKHQVLATVRIKRKGACFWNAEDNVEMDDQSQPPSSLLRKTSKLSRASSLNWKAWKKVFTRSNSF